MTDSPYKPPGIPRGAGGGHAPIPAVPVASRRRGAIPAAPVQLPRRPLDAGEDEEQKEKAEEETNHWAYQYRGYAGTPPGDIEAASNEFPLKPSIELLEARPLSVLFYQDTQTLQPATTASGQNFPDYVFDGTSTTAEDLQPGTFRVNTTPNQFDATIIYIAVAQADGNLKQYLERNVSPQIELHYESSWLRFTITAWEFHAGGAADYLTLTVESAGSDIHYLSTPGAGSEPTTQTFNDFIFDSTLFGVGMADNRLRFSSSGQTESAYLYVSVPTEAGSLREYLEQNSDRTIEIHYGATSWFSFTIAGFSIEAGAGVDVLTVQITQIETHLDDYPSTEFQYNSDTGAPSPSDPGAGFCVVYLVGGETTPPRETATEINLSALAFSGAAFDPGTVPPGTIMRWEWSGGVTRWTVDAVSFETTHYSFTVTPLDSVGNLDALGNGDAVQVVIEVPRPIANGEAVSLVLNGMGNPGPDVVEQDGPIENEQAVSVVMGGFALANAAVRARVRYRTGKSDVQFDCDWSGGFMVHADRLEIARVVFAPDTTRPYIDAPVEISATVLADAPRPGGSISLTVPPVAVPRPNGDRFYAFPIHALARRVNLLMKYGNDEDVPGDAPLGQIFLAFVGKYDRSLCYIDAMAAREALFGGGLPVPSGVSKLVVSNRSLDDSVQIGVVWRLDI